MHWIDWIFVALPLFLVLGIGLYANSYLRSVADFLSGGRLAGRYLLCVAKSEQGSGAAVFVATFEAISHAGFVTTWWGWFGAPLALILAISGWVIYRFRETRALTLSQFFEMRYSRSFRIFTGVLGVVAGVINYGIIPAVGARFLTYFMGLPRSIHVFGGELDTYIPVMALMLVLTLILTISGGLITLMITNCMEGMITSIFFLVIIIFLLRTFSWSDINDVLAHQPTGKSLLNPFDAFEVSDFNVWLCLIGLWSMFYRNIAWQNQSGYNTAAVTAHEGRMGSIMGGWRGMGNGVVLTLLAVCAMTYLHHPHYAAEASIVQRELEQIPQKKIQRQMMVPVALEHMLPEGVKGALCVILLMGVFGGDGNHLHSWGSLFIQDVVLPLRKKSLTPEEHIRYLRWSMTGVAVFAFVFGSLFRQTEYVFMWWAVTESIYVGGAGIAIIGGLYWKKGTTAGAWSGLITGSSLATGGILARQIWGDSFPLNGAYIGFWASVIACVVYAIVSLLTCKEDHDMDRLLHRGKYAIQEEKKFETKSEKRVIWGKIIGIDENFTRGDKFLAGGLFGWSMLWFGVLVVGSIWNLLAPWPITVWSNFWYVQAIALPILFAFITTIWFTVGGVVDMKRFFKRLKEAKVNVLDNGMVEGHQSLSDISHK